MSQKPNRVLSKSRLMRGIQCPKGLWLAFHRPDWDRGADAAKQLQFDEGDEVGDLARKHEGDGTLIDKDYWDFDGAHNATQTAINNGASLIFEASFRYDEFFARADILKKDALGWHLIEVKKSTQVKEYHIKDSAVQTFIIEVCGIELQSISIRHINSECQFPDLSNLFDTVDITEQVREIEQEISDEVLKLKAAVDSDEPAVQIGPHCDAPFECTFKYHFWDRIPKDSFFSLPGIRSKKKWDLFEEGYSRVSELKASNFEGITKRAIEVAKRKKLYIDNETINAQISEWK